MDDNRRRECALQEQRAVSEGDDRRQLLDTISAACDGEIVTGFALVVELAGESGARALMTYSSDALGDANLPTWTAEGLLKYALDNDVFDAVREDSDGDDE
jgi:hypothetical protein